ncbi:hypothetical protein V8B97DRAFT_642292 [Scleroderma yunnanense]
MPLEEVELPFDTESLKNGSNQFIIFFSSRVDGTLWCGDCAAVEELVNETFRPEDGQQGILVYVGLKVEWKSADSIFRGEPWNLTAIPTIIKLNKVRQFTTLFCNKILVLGARY